jgi:hypothetical protein
VRSCGVTRVAPFLVALALLAVGCVRPEPAARDWIRDLQVEAIRDGRHDVVRWGPDP